jgi:regulatory protein
MAGRGIPREVADAALADLRDDDLERALDYARTKAVSLARLDAQTGLRRLVGQLTRRGYPSHVAMTAARQALDEQSRSSGPSFS